MIPQGLAYAQLAGMPAHRGLYAAAVPPIAAALLASSPHLQTGPTALTALLSFGALSALETPGSPEYVRLGLLLALIQIPDFSTPLAIMAESQEKIARRLAPPTEPAEAQEETAPRSAPAAEPAEAQQQRKAPRLVPTTEPAEARQTTARRLAPATEPETSSTAARQEERV